MERSQRLSISEQQLILIIPTTNKLTNSIRFSQMHNNSIKYKKHGKFNRTLAVTKMD